MCAPCPPRANRLICGETYTLSPFSIGIKSGRPGLHVRYLKIKSPARKISYWTFKGYLNVTKDISVITAGNQAGVNVAIDFKAGTFGDPPIVATFSPSQCKAHRVPKKTATTPTDDTKRPRTLRCIRSQPGFQAGLSITKSLTLSKKSKDFNIYLVTVKATNQTAIPMPLPTDLPLQAGINIVKNDDVFTDNRLLCQRSKKGYIVACTPKPPGK